MPWVTRQVSRPKLPYTWEATNEKLQRIRILLPRRIQLQILGVSSAAFSSGPTADDHVWHSFSALRPATAQEMKAPVFNTLENFLQSVKAVEVWDETLSPHWDI